MENITCHSNHSSNSNGIKNIIYVDVNVLSIHAKFQLQPPYGFRREDTSIFFKLEKVSMGHGCPRLLFLFHLQLNIGYTISEQCL